MNWLRNRLREWLGVNDLLSSVNTLVEQLAELTKSAKKLAELTDILADRVMETEQDVSALNVDK